MCKAARPKKSNTSRQTPNTPTFPLPFLLFPVINRPEVSDTQPFPSELSLPTVSPGTRTYPHFYFISSIYSFRAFSLSNFLAGCLMVSSFVVGSAVTSDRAASRPRTKEMPGCQFQLQGPCKGRADKLWENHPRVSSLCPSTAPEHGYVRILLSPLLDPIATVASDSFAPVADLSTPSRTLFIHSRHITCLLPPDPANQRPRIAKVFGPMTSRFGSG